MKQMLRSPPCRRPARCTKARMCEEKTRMYEEWPGGSAEHERCGCAAPLCRDHRACERPREEWIEISVLARIDEPAFARGRVGCTRARGRMIEPSIVRGPVSCPGVAGVLAHPDPVERTGTRSYRSNGSERWRLVAGPRWQLRSPRNG